MPALGRGVCSGAASAGLREAVDWPDSFQAGFSHLSRRLRSASAFCSSGSGRSASRGPRGGSRTGGDPGTDHWGSGRGTVGRRAGGGPSSGRFGRRGGQPGSRRQI